MLLWLRYAISFFIASHHCEIRWNIFFDRIIYFLRNSQYIWLLYMPNLVYFCLDDSVYWIREYVFIIFHLTQITKFMWPTWGPHGFYRPHVGPMLAQWVLLSGKVCKYYGRCVNRPMAFNTTLYTLSPPCILLYTIVEITRFFIVSLSGLWYSVITQHL